MRTGELRGSTVDRLMQTVQSLPAVFEMRLQSVALADNLVNRMCAHARQQFPHVAGERPEVGLYHTGVAGEAGPKLLVLSCDAHGASIQVALASHDAADRQQSSSTESKLFRA